MTIELYRMGELGSTWYDLVDDDGMLRVILLTHGEKLWDWYHLYGCHGDPPEPGVKIGDDGIIEYTWRETGCLRKDKHIKTIIENNVNPEVDETYEYCGKKA